MSLLVYKQPWFCINYEAGKLSKGAQKLDNEADFEITRRTFLLGVSALTSLTGLTALGQRAEAADFNFQPFSFAVISDVHLATGQPDNLKLLQESQLFLQDVAKALNETNPDFVIFAGDQVEGPGREDAYWNLFIDVMAAVSSPWYFVLGETDVTGPSPVDRARTYGPDFKARGFTSGKSYWSCDPVKGVHLVGLDTAKANSNTGDLSEAQLRWLKEDLSDNRGKFTIVVSHHPLLPPPPYDGGPPFEDYTTAQGASAREIMGSSDVRLALSGHVPVNKVQRESGIWYVSCPSVSMYPCQYKTFQVTTSGIFMETHSIRYPALVKKAQKIMAGSSLAFQYSNHRPEQFLQLAEGNELDRTAALPLAAGPAQKLRKQKAGKSHSEKSSQTKEKPGKAKAETEKDLKEKPQEKPQSKPQDNKPQEIPETEADDLKASPKAPAAETKAAPEANSAPAPAPTPAPASAPTPAPAPMPPIIKPLDPVPGT